MAPLIVIACGAKKSTGGADVVPAAELYVGSLFRSSLRWARSVAADEDIRILSALYGLVRLDQELADYDVRLGAPESCAPDWVFIQAEEQQLLERDVIVVGGQDYVAFARRAWPAASSFVELAVHGRGSLGAIRGALAQHIGRIPQRVIA